MPFTSEDFPLLFDLHSDPEVNRYHSPGFAPMAAEEARQRLETYVSDHARLGISKWKLETQEGQFIGRAGFSWLKEPEGYELGYSLKRAVWGKGIATEISRALVDWFFRNTSQDHLFAYAVAEHIASLKVMRKAGMHPWMEMEKHGRNCSFFRITRQEFEGRASA